MLSFDEIVSRTYEMKKRAKSQNVGVCCDMNDYCFTFRSPKGMGCQFHYSVFYLFIYDTSLFDSVFDSNQLIIVIGVHSQYFVFSTQEIFLVLVIHAQHHIIASYSVLCWWLMSVLNRIRLSARFPSSFIQDTSLAPTPSTLRDIVHTREPIISILLPIILSSERTENFLWDHYSNMWHICWIMSLFPPWFIMTISMLW